jgi:hypothetical protein
MIPQILASSYVEFMPFVMIIAIVALVFWYLLNKKRLEHQQIMAAIEKGAPLSELRPVEQKKKEIDWIRSLTVGVAFLLMGSGWILMRFIGRGFCFTDTEANSGVSLAALVLIAIGIAGIIRGILQRKVDKALSSDKSALNANNGQ